jgi:hypothetical protein
VTSTFDDGAPAWATPRRKKIPPDHLYSSTLIRGIVKNQNPKRVCRLHQESRQRRAGQFPVLIRTLGIPRHRVAYRGDNQSLRILYPINGLHALNVAG